MNAREQAVDILIDVCLNNAYANLKLRKINKYVAYTTKTVYGTLQNYLLLEYLVQKYTTKLKSKIKLLLMCAVYELKFMDSDHFALINEFVELSKKYYRGHYSKVVNAVLHKLIEQPVEVDIADEDEYLSIQTSHPLWLVKMWKKQYGPSLCKQICFANLEEKITYLRINPQKTTEHTLLKNPAYQKNEYGIYYVKGNPATTKEYREGLYSIQDYASQQVGICLEAKENERIIDLCAAPGTKTLQIAQICNDNATIDALDLYPHRVALIEEAKQRLGYQNINLIVDDATTFTTDVVYDRVLVDAICSGYGVLKGKSDIKYRMKSTDMDEIITIQKAILENSAKLVKKNGILVYSTCTLNKKENEFQIIHFLNNHPEFELVFEQTLFPIKHDGFYIAKLKRKN